jgi:outer membrane protein assembly factor BamE (lipoprotein component of BamABCDE complex)
MRPSVCTSLVMVFTGLLAMGSLAAGDEEKIPTREEFKKLVLGETPENVLKAVGKPDTTSEGGDDAFWYYKGKTRDSITGKVDDTAQVVFRKGRVEGVNFAGGVLSIKPRRMIHEPR